MHLAIIMDGNGRWAKQRHLPRSAGHLEGLKTCKKVVKAASYSGIEFLTLYVFSTENIKRPAQEVNYLMKLLANKLPEEVPFFKEHNIRILCKGDTSSLPCSASKGISDTIEKTSSNTGLTVVLAVNYGGRDEIVRAVNKALECKSALTATDIQMNLDCPDIPDPDLIVRTAGEMRLSNFLLWACAYSELYFSENLWPDWAKEDIDECIRVYSQRKRKFGNIV